MTSDVGTTTVTMPSDHEIRMTRVFEAPQALVFAVHTEPEHVARWQLGPDGWSMPLCEIDLRPGGAWKFVWRNDETGDEFDLNGEYLEVESPRRLVQTEGMGDGPKGVTTLVLTEEEGRTRLTATMRFPSREMRDEVAATGMADGASISYDRLEKLLATLV